MTDTMAKKIISDLLDELDGHTTPRPEWSNVKAHERDKSEALRIALKQFDECDRLRAYINKAESTDMDEDDA